MDTELQRKLEASPATQPLVTQLEDLRRTLETHPPVEQDEERHRRATALLDTAERFLATIDVNLVSAQFAADGASRLAALRVDIESHGSVRQADGPMDSLADWLRGLPVVDPEFPFDVLRQRLDEAAAALEAMRVEREQIISDADAAERRMLEEIRSLREQVKFLKEQGQDAYTELADKIHEGGEAFLTAVREHTAEVEDERVEIVKAARDAVDEAEKVVAQIREKLAIVSDESVSAGYDQAAKAEREQADTFRALTITLGILAAAAALAGFILSLQSDYSWAWERTVAKVSVVAAITSLAVYCSHQSQNHRRVARRHEDVALRLFNLGGYLAELDPEERARVRAQLVDEFFLSREQKDDGNETLRPGRRLAREA